MMTIEKSHIYNSVELSKAREIIVHLGPLSEAAGFIGIEASLVISSGRPPLTLSRSASLSLSFLFFSVFLWRCHISILVRISISNFPFLSGSKQNKGGRGRMFKKNGRSKASQGCRIQWTFYRQSSPEISKISDSDQFLSFFFLPFLF